jgi:Tfp pilus assembly protein FimT
MRLLTRRDAAVADSDCSCRRAARFGFHQVDHTTRWCLKTSRVVRWVIPAGDKTLNHNHPNNLNVVLADYNAKSRHRTEKP